MEKKEMTTATFPKALLCPTYRDKLYQKWKRDFEASLRSRCDECKINPDYCPQECDSKLNPKEILG